MKTYNSNAEVVADVVNGVLNIDDDIEIAFDGFRVDADIYCKNIFSKDRKRDINCRNITCREINCSNITCSNITCRDINCRDITCWDINCGDINCGDINCWGINCGDINCGDINCRNITCRDISYYAVCFAYKDIVCKSIEGRRKNCKHFVLDGVIKRQKLEVSDENAQGKVIGSD